jgi:hypothetical protein
MAILGKGCKVKSRSPGIKRSWSTLAWQWGRLRVTTGDSFDEAAANGALHIALTHPLPLLLQRHDIGLL